MEKEKIETSLKKNELGNRSVGRTHNFLPG